MPLIGEVDFYHLDQTIRRRMPLTDRVVEHHAADAPFEGVTALFFQHQLGNQVPMVDALIRLGLDPKGIHWVDIPYTSHERVRDVLGSMGIPPENFRTCDDFRLLSPYAPYQRRRAVQAYRELLDSDPEHLLVLDDGAYFLEAASCFEKRFRRCAIVEQTSRGFKKLAKNAAMAAILKELPLIDVARSVPKRMLESPFIGAAVGASLAHHLEGQLERASEEARCLVLGYGHIGRSVAKSLDQTGGFARENVFVSDPRLRDGEIEAPFSSWTRGDGGTFDLIVGCSGTTSFDVGDAVFLNDGAVLVSASSGAVEFNRRNVVEWASASDLDDLWIGEGIKEDCPHSTIPIHFPGRDVRLLNGGFPANFDGRICCVPDRYIQITMGLMVQAAVQAVRAETPGVHALDVDVSIDLTQAYYREVQDALDWLPDEREVIESVRAAQSAAGVR